jgi:ABC-type uncharacterized transport system permease subunit
MYGRQVVKSIRATQRALISIAGSLVSILCGLIVVGLFLVIAGRYPIRIYSGIFTSAFGDGFALSETLVAATPVMLCALGVAVAARVGLMNIGVEGQLLAGAVGSTFIALTLPATMGNVIAYGYHRLCLWSHLECDSRSA